MDKVKVMCGYGTDKKNIGTIEVVGNKMIINVSDKSMADTFMRGPYNPETEGQEALGFLIGRFATSSTIAFVEIK
jgi:hypothetical protein